MNHGTGDKATAASCGFRDDSAGVAGLAQHLQISSSDSVGPSPTRATPRPAGAGPQTPPPFPDMPDPKRRQTDSFEAEKLCTTHRE